MNRVIIFLPGIMGSQLYKGRDLIWPGSVSSLIFPYSLMDQLLDPSLDVGDIIRTFSASEQYNALISKLGVAEFTETKGNLRVCPYDWRKRNEDAAEVLAQMIGNISADVGQDCEISLIAHSMGGLISRYYLESGIFTQRPGFATVKNLFTLGTPHRGSPLALTAAVGLEKRLFLNRDQVKQLVERPEFPSVYQLLPPPGDDFAWDDRDGDDRYRSYPVYDSARELNLVQANLDAARNFHARLTGKPRQGVRYFCFAGTRMSTLTHVRVSGTGTLQVLRVEADDAGDGTVPSWSGTLPGIQRQFVGGEHGTIYKSRELLTTLGGLLGAKNTLAANVPAIQLAVRDKVMEPSTTVHVSISFPSSVTGVSAHVTVERLFIHDDGTVQRTAVVQTFPVAYSGMGAEKLGLTFRAPQDAGLYRAQFVDDKGSPATPDDFFIQDI